MKKHFLKIAKVGSEVEFYDKYPTPETFFTAHPEARNMMGMGGTPEAFPQIATFDQAFSYGVPPGPQYLSHGGSAYPQAQTEQQFFIPIYTDVYNPYNKAMGGSKKSKYQPGGATLSKRENEAANKVYGRMIYGIPTDGYDEFLTAYDKEFRAPYLSSAANAGAMAEGANTFTYANGVSDPGSYANWVNNQLGRQAVMPLQKSFAGPYDLVGRTPNWQNLPDQMDISEPYVDSGIDYRTLKPSNPKNYMSTGEDILKMGGSNVEMYPNAKTTPHWGPSNVWFQDGGQEGTQSNGEELDRMGVLNRTGSFVNNLKTTAAKANAKNAMMGAIANGGMAKYGTQLNTYQDKGEVKETPSYLTKADLDTWWKGVSQPQTPYYPGYYPQYPYAQYPAYNVAPQGNMGDFLNNYFAYTTGSPYPGSTTKGRVSVDGQRAGKFYGNMPLIKAMMPELYGKGNFADMMKNNGEFRNRAEAMGLTSYKDRRFGADEYTFNQRVPWEAPTVTLGPKPAAPQNTTTMSVKDLINSIDKMPSQQQYNSTPTSTPSANQPTAASSSSSVNPDVDYITNSKYPDLDQPFTGTNMTQRERLLQQLNSSDPKEVEYAKYRIGAMNDWDAMQGSTTTTSQAPSNATSMDPNVAAKKAAMQKSPVNQAFIDAKKAAAAAPQSSFDPNKVTPPNYPGSPVIAAPSMTNDPYTWQSFPPYDKEISAYAPGYNRILDDGRPWEEGYATMGVYGETPNAASYISAPPYRTPVGPVVGPDGYAYGGYTGYKFGGSYKQGDVVYMSDDEIAEFIRNGGQIEEME